MVNDLLYVLFVLLTVKAKYNEPDCKEINYNDEAIMPPLNVVHRLRISDQVCDEKNECYVVKEIRDKIEYSGNKICGFIVDEVLDEKTFNLCVGESTSKFGYTCKWNFNLVNSISKCEIYSNSEYEINYNRYCVGNKVVERCNGIDAGCAGEFTGAKTVINKICGEVAYTAFYEVILKSLNSDEIKSFYIEKNDGDKFTGIVVKNSSGEFLYKDHNDIFYYWCDDKNPTTPDMVKLNENGCTRNINAKNIIIEPIRLHRYPDVILPATELKFKFSNITKCKVSHIDRDPTCQCNHKCLTTLHVINYPCLFGDELITCNETTRNMTETTLTYDLDGFPQINCFIYELINTTQDEFNSSDIIDSSGNGTVRNSFKELIKENLWKIIAGIITFIILLCVAFILIIIMIIVGLIVAAIIGLVVLKVVIKVL